VHRKIITPFAEALQTATAQVYAPEAPAPTLIAKAGVDKNRALHRDAVAKGATILYGDPAAAPDASPYRIRPVIVRDVTPAMDLWYTESFGPTLALLGVDSDDAAVALANDTEYGLSGAVFTESLARGLRIARAVDSGAVHINSMSVHDEAGLPHGGVKKSGWGRFNAQWGLEEFVKLKTVSYME
jgi:acyl-CoA reductase-like NAD-dependent aldehyde dehydrogenase